MFSSNPVANNNDDDIKIDFFFSLSLRAFAKWKKGKQ